MRAVSRCPRLLAALLLLQAVFLPPAAHAAPTFANGVPAGVVTDWAIGEASGLVASRQNPGVLWTHNDSSYGGSVFAIATNGPVLARYYVPTAFSGNYEDISFGPGPNPEHQYLYLGDIGDNFASRFNIRVFRFPEPAVHFHQSNSPPALPLTGVQEITLYYPDGPHDAECLMIDPPTGDLFIVTKLTNNACLYRATRAQLDSGLPITLSFVREMTFSGLRSVGAGDISADGSLIAIRRNGKAWLWSRAPGQAVGDVMATTPAAIPNAVEFNGESLGFHATGLGYYTLSEGYGQTNFWFRRTDTGIPVQPAVFIRPGETWRYWDAGTDLGTPWRQRFYDDSDWGAGPAPLGYGQGDEATTISYGWDDLDKIPTVYFRKQFTRAATPAVTNLALRVCFTDGIAIYLNGTEILRRNLAPEAPFAQTAFGSNADRQNFWLSVPVNPALLLTGTNTVAVELHRRDGYTPSLSFDLQLLQGTVEAAARFTSLPQLTNGLCRLPVAGPVGSLARIESSPDLQQWTTAASLTLTNGTGLFQEPAQAGTPARFYRIKRF
ncbi:MAG: hypothetical protein RJA22_1929 [Verrucomicrobiota bacterium]